MRSAFVTMRTLRAPAVLLVIVLGACSGDPGTGVLGEPVRVVLLVQPSAEAESGVRFDQAPAVELVDANGNAVPRRGVAVTVTIASGGGTVVGTVLVRTDPTGRAVFSDLGISGLAGPRTLRFSSSGVSAVLSGQVRLRAGPPATVAPLGGNNQTAAAGSDLSITPAVKVTDGAGNPIEGFEVTFEVAAGSGTLEGAVQITGVDGVARASRWTLGTAPGPNQVTVTLAGLTGSPVVFTATATVGPPSVIELIEGDGQTAAPGTPVPLAPAVKVTDAAGNPVAGVRVTFTVASGGGILIGATPTTNAEGVARVGGWVLGNDPGPNRLSVAVGTAPPVAFTATATPGGPGGDPIEEIRQVAAAGSSACYLGTDRLAWCWGSNSLRQLGDGSTVAFQVLPVRVAGGHLFDRLRAAAGGNFVCGFKSDGSPWCWGSSRHGQLGNEDIPPGNLSTSNVPVPVSGGFSWLDIWLGGDHACGITTAGLTYCWGSDNFGQLGQGGGSGQDYNSPQPVVGGHQFVTLGVGRQHVCGIRTDGAVYCWGRAGGFNNGGNAVIATPTAVPLPPGAQFVKLAGGWFSTCGLTASGQAYCWGENAVGQLGDGTTTGRSSPVAVAGGLTFDKLDVGGRTACGLTAGGEAWCWGENSTGLTGTGLSGNVLAPAKVSGFTFSAISTGASVVCGLEAGGVLCWGPNNQGQVGDGTLTQRSSPTRVLFP